MTRPIGEKYWFPCKSIHGSIWVEGPYDTRDKANAEREYAKGDVLPPAVVGTVFLAANKEEALKRAPIFI